MNAVRSKARLSIKGKPEIKSTSNTERDALNSESKSVSQYIYIF